MKVNRQKFTKSTPVQDSELTENFAEMVSIKK